MSLAWPRLANAATARVLAPAKRSIDAATERALAGTHGQQEIAELALDVDQRLSATPQSAPPFA